MRLSHALHDTLIADAFRPLSDSIENYSRAWNRSFAPKLLLLPRELFNMVYDQIWMGEYLDATNAQIVDILAGRKAKDTLPHVVDVNYVGPEIACEIVESYYQPATESLSPFEARTPDAIHRLVCEDTFHVGLDPATVLRNIVITLNLNADSVPAMEITKTSLNLLLNIVKKQGFRLDIELMQRNNYLNV